MLNQTDHPEAAALSDYASGRLDDARCTDIDRHLAECDACCDLLDRLGSGHVEELLQSLQGEAELPSFDAATPPPPQQDLTEIPVGESRYELTAEIGAGGMGVVFEAFDRQLHRRVAIKTLKPGNNDASMRERFIREALITGRLNHPGVPSTHELGTLPDGRPFMALRLVRGRNLARWLTEHRSTPSPDAASLNALLSAFGRLCDCVASAHADGIIHRDIKPANVMVGEFGEVQLMDWGLARHSEGSNSQASRSSEAAADRSPPAPTDHPSDIYSTSNGTVMGTLGYMAPEQARGDRRRTGPASDVFSLGAVLCEILTGRPPFPQADKAELTQATRSGDLGELNTRLQSSTADRALTALMLRCLDADPTLRPATAEVVATEF
ncbi:MAG: protein kinase, partial [Planctomycetaceae bacterium]|nr:protein kinase [Planctomycetaceae bacterium]